MKSFIMRYSINLVILSLAMYASCQLGSDKKPDKSQIKSEIIHVNIAAIADSLVPSLEKRILIRDSLLKMPAPHIKLGDMEIRISYSYAFKDSAQLLIIKKSSGEVTANLITLVFNFNDKRDTLLNVKKTVERKFPKSNSHILLEHIMESGVFSLPDSRSITNYPEYMDGDGILIQKWEHNSYQNIYYHQPFSAQNSNIEAKRLVDFLKMLEEELDYRRLSKPTRAFDIKPINVDVAPVPNDNSIEQHSK